MLNKSLLKMNMKVAVALSGGRDSMYLLDNLLECKEELKIKVVAINIDHGIRKKSGKDSEFVKNYCKENDVELYFKKLDCVKYSKENGLSVEEGARTLRYKVFFDAIKDGFCDVVATAHHISDNAETVLFNMFRGTGSGVKGIEDISYGKIIRPILSTERSEIDEYLRKKKIPYVDDETNFSDKYSRNYIRLKLIPKIKKRFPKIEKSLLRFNEISKKEDEYLSRLAEKEIIEKDGYIKLPCSIDEVLFSRASIIALKKSGIVKDYEKTHIDLLNGLKNAKTGTTIDMPKGVKAVNEYGFITLYKKSEKNLTEIPFGLGEISFSNRTLYLGDEVKGEKVLKFDLAKIPKTAVIRTRKEGDTFKSFGGGTKKLKDYFIDKKIPSRERDFIPLLCDGKNVLLIFGIEISDIIKVDKSTERVVKCSIL